MDNDKPNTDLCPMCLGKGEHTLQPPDGKFYRTIVMNYVIYEENAQHNIVDSSGAVVAHAIGDRIIIETIDEKLDRFDKTLNEWAKKGYEVINVTAEGSTRVVTLQWRWR